MKQKGYHIPGPRYVRIWFKKRIQFQINRKYIIQYMILEKLESYLFHTICQHNFQLV